MELLHGTTSRRGYLLVPPTTAVGGAVILSDLVPVFLTASSPTEKGALSLTRSSPLVRSLSYVILSRVGLIGDAKVERRARSRTTSILGEVSRRRT